MRKLYSAGFDVGLTKVTGLKELIGEVKAWVTSSEGRPTHMLAPLLRHDFTATGRSAEGERVLETVRWTSEGKEVWGLRWIQPAAEVDEPRIISEVILRQSGSGLNVSIHIGYERGVPVGQGVTPRRPRIVPELLKRFGGSAGIPLEVTPLVLGLGDVDAFVQGVLAAPKRRLPVVLLSVDPDLEGLSCRADLAADVLAGMAHVYTLADVDTSYALTDAVGKKHSCFNGCGRIYWPGWSLDDDPFRHRLFWPDELIPEEGGTEYRGPNRLLQVIAAAAVAIRHPQPRGFEEALLERARAESTDVTLQAAQIFADMDDKNEQIEELTAKLQGVQARIAELERRKIPRLRVAVFMGSAEKPGARRASWDRRLADLAKENGMEIDAEYFDVNQRPKGFDVWILDQKTVPRHAALKTAFGKGAKEGGAKWLSVRDTSDVQVSPAALTMPTGG